MALSYSYPNFNISRDRILKDDNGEQLFNELQSLVERIRDFHRDTVAKIVHGESPVLGVTSTTGATVTAGIYPVILCNASGAGVTVNLPAASVSTGTVYYIKKIDSSGNTVTIDASGSELIDGATTSVLSSQFDGIAIVCNGTAWYVISRT